MFSRGAHALPGVGAALLLFLAIWSAAWGIADLYSIHGRHYLERRSSEVQPAFELAWQNALGSLQRAVALNPYNPGYKTDVAQMYELAARGHSPWDADVRHSLEQSLNYYRQAIIRRPTWPYGWAGLARIKLRLLQFDAEFDQALQQAVAFGVREQGVQLLVVEIGFIAWQRLSPDARDAVRQVLEKADQRQVETFQRLAEHHDHAQLVPLIGRERAVVSGTLLLPR